MTRRLAIEDLYKVVLPEQPALSPDGAEIVYVLRTVDRVGDRATKSLWHVGATGSEPRQFTHGTTDSAPTWSPDGTRIAFLRGEPAQVWVFDRREGEPDQVTSLPLGAGTPVWSPDGTRIAFAAPVDLMADAGEDDSDRARRTTAPVVTDRLDFKADSVGLLGSTRKHVHIVELATHDTRRVTSGDWQAGDPVWSPDGTLLAFAGPHDADADLTFRAAIYVVDATRRAAIPRLVGPAGGMRGPIGGWMGPVGFSDDGEWLFIVGREEPTPGHTHLLRLQISSGLVENLVAPLDRNLMPGGPGYPGALPQLAGDAMLFCARDRGYTNLYATDVVGTTPRVLVGGASNVCGMSLAGSIAAIVLATPTSYGEIATVDVESGEVVVRTAHSSLESVELLVPTEHEFVISDGRTVHGWLLRDESLTTPGPLLLDIHGGPHNSWNGVADPAHAYHQVLATRGWSVLLLNPRGSDGYGEEFYNAALGAWGEADAADLLEPLDQLVSAGVADPKRLAVTGYSYGGYMTCYLTSRDGRFAAAVPGGVLTDMASMAGTSDGGHFLGTLEVGGTPWADGVRFAELSPISQVDRVNTPTLIIQGAADDRCPVGQAEQWFTALRERGVPARLALYPGASHLFILNGPPSQRVDWNCRLIEWVEQYAGDAAGPRPARIDAARWKRRLGELAEAHGVPGASLGILRVGRGDAADDVVEAAYGVLNTSTGLAATSDSVFQIGSMTKVWTATVVMRLVEQGLLDLDAPVVDVLPEFQLANPDVAERVTMRHLLTHTSGIDGDVFTDTGRGDECIERYIAQLGSLNQNLPLGEMFSYSNAGFILAGRVIEKLTGKTWDEAMAEYLFAPLEMTRAVTLPEQILLHRAALGHVSGGGGELQPASVAVLSRSFGPAGLITCSAADVLAFARLHLAGGLAPDGTRLLSQSSVELMASHQSDLPDKFTFGDSWGLGWMRFGWDDHRLMGHDGNMVGQSAFLRVLPEEGLVVALLTNGGNARDLYEDLYREIFGELAGVTMPRPFGPPDKRVDANITPHVGRYERAGANIDVLSQEGKSTMRVTITGPFAATMPEPVQEFDMIPVDDTGDVWAVRAPGSETWKPVTFCSLPTGEEYVHFALRATPRVA